MIKSAGIYIISSLVIAFLMFFLAIHVIEKLGNPVAGILLMIAGVLAVRLSVAELLGEKERRSLMEELKNLTEKN